MDAASANATSLAWHPDSARLAAGCDSYSIQLWDINGRAGPVLPLVPTCLCSAVAWSTRGHTLFATSLAGFVHAWNTRTLEHDWIAFHTGPDDVTVIDSTGRFLHHTPRGLKQFVYLVERPDQRLDLRSPEEFAKLAGETTSQVDSQ
jgi:WD40 repeat protein